MEPQVESMTDQERLSLWMHHARRLRLLADVAEKALLAAGCIVLVIGGWMLSDQQYLGGALTVVGGLAGAILGPALGALGQNQASINECHCRMLDQLKRIGHDLEQRPPEGGGDRPAM